MPPCISACSKAKMAKILGDESVSVDKAASAYLVVGMREIRITSSTDLLSATLRILLIQVSSAAATCSGLAVL